MALPDGDVQIRVRQIYCVLTSSTGSSLISDIKVCNDYVTSDHFPLCIHLDIQKCDTHEDNGYSMSKKINWSKLSNCDLEKYRQNTNIMLSKISIDYDLFTCNNIKCDLVEHKQTIDDTYK